MAAGLTRLRDLTANAYHDWYDALEHLSNEAEREPALLVLDEFPELLRKYRTAIERGRGATVLPAIERELDDFMGLPYEDAFRECLWEKAFDGTLGLTDIVDIGPWWTGGGQGQIDAVLLAEPELTRLPVAVGESKWAH